MKRTGRLIALGMSLVMLFSLAGCKTKVKEYDKDSLVSALESELNIDEDDMYISRSESDVSGHPSADCVTASYKDARINAFFCDNATSAKEVFAAYYTEFENTFNQDGQFKGTYAADKTDDYGYIVINGDMSGVSIFGDRYRAGSLHAGLYHNGSMLIMIIPSNPDGIDNAGEIIEALGLIDA